VRSEQAEAAVLPQSAYARIIAGRLVKLEWQILRHERVIANLLTLKTRQVAQASMMYGRLKADCFELSADSPFTALLFHATVSRR